MKLVIIAVVCLISLTVVQASDEDEGEAYWNQFMKEAEDEINAEPKPVSNCDISDHGAQTQNTYCQRKNKDCYGHDIRAMTVSEPGLDECQSACDEDSDCLSVQQWGTHCYLKNFVCRNGELSTVDVASDYVKRGPGISCETCQDDMYSYCHRPTSDCYGHDIRHIEVNSLAECQAECDKDCECKAVQQWGTKCWLKTHICDSSELTSSPNGNDYYKRAPNQECPRPGQLFDPENEK